MKIVMCLGIWIAFGLVCAFLTGMLMGHFEHERGYEETEVDRIREEVADIWLSKHFVGKSFLHRWMYGTIVPLIFWPYHLRTVVIENHLKAWEIYENRRKEGS